MSDELIQRVRTVIANTQRIPVEKIAIDSSFEELGIDSMDGVNILFALENEFNITIPDEEAKQIRNVRQMIEGVEKLIAGGPAPLLATWMLASFGWQAISVYIIACVVLTLAAVVLLPDRSRADLPAPAAVTPAAGQPAPG